MDTLHSLGSTHICSGQGTPSPSGDRGTNFSFTPTLDSTGRILFNKLTIFRTEHRIQNHNDLVRIENETEIIFRDTGLSCPHAGKLSLR